MVFNRNVLVCCNRSAWMSCVRLHVRGDSCVFISVINSLAGNLLQYNYIANNLFYYTRQWKEFKPTPEFYRILPDMVKAWSATISRSIQSIHTLKLRLGFLQLPVCTHRKDTPWNSSKVYWQSTDPNHINKGMYF